MPYNWLGNREKPGKVATRERRWSVVGSVATLYLLGIVGDFLYHLATAFWVGDQRLTWSDAVVGFEASLFWPVDLAIKLLVSG